MPIDATGSVDNLNQVAADAGAWSPRLLVWADRFKAYEPPDPGVLGGRPDPSEIDGMTSDWGRDADAYQAQADGWLNVLTAGANNAEVLGAGANEAKDKAAREYGLASSAWAVGDADAAAVHNDAASGYLDLAQQYLDLFHEYDSAWRDADQAVRASEAALTASKNAANTAVNRHNGVNGVSWKTVAIVGALGGSALLALGIYARR